MRVSAAGKALIAAFSLIATTLAFALPTPAPVAAPLLAGDCAHSQRLQIAGSTLKLEFNTADYALDATQICAWTERSAQAVAGYFERFPVPTVRIVFQPADSAKVSGGTTYGDSGGHGPLIVIRLGRDAGQAALDRDWVLTHEMVHLAVPSVPEQSHWLEEGIATYVEPIARVRLGQLDVRKVWADMLDGMPKGLPRAGDRGLERTPTWGRTYWGGALFCLLADVAIRQQSDNRLSLRDALRGVLKAGGSIEEDWSAERVFAAGDRAIGMTVLTDLYHQMGLAPGPAELDSLWQRLGVHGDGDDVSFTADAPLAAVRAAITAPARRAERPS